MTTSILIVDDEQDLRDSLALLLADEGYAAETAESGDRALEVLATRDVSIVLCDIRMPGIDGITLLRRVRERYPDTAVIIMTAYATVDTAVGALRSGASDYILKPVDFGELLIRIRHITEHRRIVQENAVLRSRLHDNGSFENIIGASRPMQQVFDLIRKVAGTRSTVLITGRSGTGKELVAKAIHYNSDRRQRVFLPINCGAISETLIESELFGHKRGAFTDAFQDKQGVFQLADGGTLFLDEVAEIPMHLQVKLLRALDEREVTPVGGSAAVKVDVRIVCATNQDLEAKVAAGTFREDLYYRLNVIEIRLPTLSERMEDIPLLVDHFLRKYGAEMRKPVLRVDNGTMRALVAHEWNGGVRELENVIERAVIFSDTDTITLESLPANFSSHGTVPVPPDDLRQAMDIYERRHILAVLQRADFNKEAAARALNIGLSSLYRKIDELGITAQDLKT